MTSYTDALDTADHALERIGGKGRSLARLLNAGFRVPTGFHVTTDAYRRFVASEGLQASILDRARPEAKDGRASFEAAAVEIKGLFDAATMNAEIVNAVRHAVADLGDKPVAVRSSANAEDLPDLSFAGQQETFLNVRGEEAVLAAIKACWASLWTTQAMSYRHQNGIAPASVAMAVVVQEMVPADVAGILFTANPATGERGELVVNASFGLGEAIVGGEVTPDTYVLAREGLAVTERVIGAKEQQTVADGDQGTKLAPVDQASRAHAVLDDAMLRELATTALAIEAAFDGVPQDIEWAVSGGRLHVLQARPITNLPVQPITVDWSPPPPSRYLSRRQIVENMPDPICPLFEELYLTEGLESTRKGKSLMVGGGPMFMTVNGYAYQRFDWPQFFTKGADDELKAIGDADLDRAEYDATMKEREQQFAVSVQEMRARQATQADRDLAKFADSLDADERARFDAWVASQDDGIAVTVTMPASENPTFVAFNNTETNDGQLGEWHEVTRPRLVAIREKWAKVDTGSATDGELLDGIREMGVEEGYYWSSNSSHTFGVAKSTDDQLQCFLREALPDHHFISGQFLSGIESKTMQANADLFEIAKLVRRTPQLTETVIVTPVKLLMRKLRELATIEPDSGQNAPTAKEVVGALDDYLDTYGHQGYSMDFVEPTQVEDPSGLLASLKAMVADADYDPKAQDERAARVRREKSAEIAELLQGLPYWQFRFRLWLARRYNYIREEVAFHFGYTWCVLRPFAQELGRRLAEAGTLKQSDDVYFLVTAEIESAIEARANGDTPTELAELASDRRQLREARKRHHPPGTLPAEASQIKGISFKETQILNDDGSDTMRGFPVSSGRVTAPASVVLGPGEFDKMAPGSILVSPLTTPAWTQLFAHAAGLVTDMGSILAHGSIVAREYGIPAVLGVGNGTVRIKHGQTLTIDGDAGTVLIHDD